MNLLRGLCVGAAACWATMAIAAGPVAEHIPADAKACIHFDTALIRDSALLKAFREEMGVTNPVDKTLGQIAIFIGMNLLEDTDGITFYTTTLGDGEGTLLIYGKIPQDEVLKHLDVFPQHVAEAYGDRKIHSWFDQQRQATVAGVVTEKWCMWGDSVARVKAALDVIDGKKDGKYAVAVDFPKGALFGAGVTDMPAFAKKPDQQMFLLAKFMEVALSEDKGTVKAMITAGMADTEQAGQVKQIADGLKAFAALNKEKVPDLAKLVGQIKTAADGSKASATLERPAATVFSDIKKIQAATEGKGK